MEGEKFNLGEKKLGDKVQAKSSNLPRRFCSNSVGTPLEFAAFRSGFDAKYSRASAFLFFFCPQPWFLRRSEHIHRKNTSIFMQIGSLSPKKKLVLKINLRIDIERSWPGGLT